jgi:predicted nuclease of predicted toxin-antitoxin system
MNFFFDNNISLNMARAMELLDIECCVRHLQEQFEEGTKDEEWLPFVGDNGYILVTRDKKITKRKGELEAYKRHKVGAFILTGKNMPIWAQVKQLILSWEKMKNLAEKTPRPFAFQIRSKGKIIPISL